MAMALVVGLLVCSLPSHDARQSSCDHGSTNLDSRTHNQVQHRTCATAASETSLLQTARMLHGRQHAAASDTGSHRINETSTDSPYAQDENDCCSSCAGHLFCSPYSKKCYAERTKSYYQRCDAPAQTCASYGCANVYIPYRSCHCNYWCVQFNSCCEDYQSMCTDAGLSNCRGQYDASQNSEVPCLCLFDIDRTLTGKQGYVQQCPRNQEASPTIWDDAYGGGSLTLSAFAAEGINNTFCNRCYTGVVSAGSGSNDLEREMITDKILTTEKMRELVQREPRARSWTKGYIPRGGSVQSPFVRYQADREKQHAVRAIQRWYDSKGICIPDFAVHFFGDRTENMRFFDEYAGFNSREISCGSRDNSILNGMVGQCGATPEEIVEERGIFNCPSGDNV